jgi:hypothetical protein
MNKVIIWGCPPHSHTHSYIHYGFAKSFASLDYDVVWYEDSEEYQSEDFSNSIVITAYGHCNHMPIDRSAKYFVHNIEDGFYSQNKILGDNIYNLLVYHEGYNWNDKINNIDEFSWYDSSTKTAVIMWATDLLPDEIQEQQETLYDPHKDSVNYVGSLSGEYIQKFSPIVESKGKKFKNYGGYSGIRSQKTDSGFIDDDESIQLIKESYLNFDLRPQGHLENGYIPCRIFKTMSYGCWVGTNSEKVLKFFDGRISANSDLSSLYEQTEQTSKNATLEILKDNKDYISKNHTYINRINSLLAIL